MILRGIATGLAVLALVFAAPHASALGKKSKKEKLEEAKAKVRAKYVEKMGGRVFHDCTHWLDYKGLDDSRWDVPQKHRAYDSDLDGIQLIGRFSTNAEAGTGTMITVICQKWQQTDTSSKFSLGFDHLGERYMIAQVKKCHDAFYRDWVKSAKDVLTKQCVKPKKKKMGQAEYFASAVGTDPEDNVRVRRDWYMWGKSNETFLITVEYSASVLKSKGMIKKGEEFVKRIKRVKEKVPIIRK